MDRALSAGAIALRSVSGVPGCAEGICGGRQLIADYRKQFPDDQIFPVKAKAMVEYRQGSVREGLSVYEQSFQPLWDPQLVKSYFDLSAGHAESAQVSRRCPCRAAWPIRRI